MCTGLRPGEKLHEELLIDAESEATAHPLIYRARERAVPPEELWPQIDALAAAIERQDVEAVLGVLAALVPEWKRAGEPGGVTEAPTGAEAAAGGLMFSVACRGAQAGGFVSAAGVTPELLGSCNGSVRCAQNLGQSQEGVLGPRLTWCVPRGTAPS